MIPAYLPLCKVCYLECMAGKTVSVVLKDNLGTATFNSGAQKIDFPTTVPVSRFPKKGIKKKALLANWKGLPCAEDRSGSVVAVSSSVKLLVCSIPHTGEVSPTNRTLDSMEDFPSSNCEPFSFGEKRMLANENEAINGIPVLTNQNLAISQTGKRTCLAVSAFDSTLFYVDSGAGQCLCSCDAAFIHMSPCEIEISGVAGCLQIYGIGPALFIALDENGQEVVIRIHNCLFSQGEFNLISVSQLCGKPENSVDLSLDFPALHLMSSGQRSRRIQIPLFLDDGLFAARFESIQPDDPRFSNLPKCDITPGGDFTLATSDSEGRWKSRVMVSASKSARILVASSDDYHCNLESFCGDFLAPPSLPPAKRTYNGANPSDLADLSIRFLGVGTKRLLQTIALSNGLSSVASGSVVPTHLFPPGRWKESKTPRVSKGKLVNLHTASVGEVVFTDTFESGDSKYKYGQIYYDYASGWGDVFPIRSRTEVGRTLEDFCCRNWIPLCLVSDNAGENIGGDFVEVARRLCIQRVYICPRHPMQNYAEGYLGRITAMASFAMVHAGAPLFMWIYSVRAAVFTNNIAAKYYRLKIAWATPHHAVHGEAFADSSIVVPFGCGALILRDSDDRPKFITRCTLMIFLHYADDHPLFTYAFFSPRTKRVLYRQDAIFLTNLFPMRAAREASGMDASGDQLVTFRSPACLRDGSPPEFSFGTWTDSEGLPAFEDDVTGFGLDAPPGTLVREPVEVPELPVHFPNYPGFSQSVVSVPIPASAFLKPKGELEIQRDDEEGIDIPGFSRHYDQYEAAGALQPPNDVSPGPRRSERVRSQFVPRIGSRDVAVSPTPAISVSRRVNDRWYYEDKVKPVFIESLDSLDGFPGRGDAVQRGDAAQAPEIIQSIDSLGGFPGRGDAVQRGDAAQAPGNDNGPSGEDRGTRPRIRIGLTLTFPDGERNDQRYSGHPGWTVSHFKERMGRLLATSSPIILTVGPEWGELEHLGLISDRTLPGTSTPCPFLSHDSVVRVQQIPRWTGGPDSLDRPLRITLNFPDGEQRNQQYSLHRHVTVPQFKGYLATLMGTTSQIILEVNPDWEELDHLGPVSAHVFPGSSISCPYLTQRSIVRVRLLASLAQEDGTVGPPPTPSSHEERPLKRFCESPRVGEGESGDTNTVGESLQSSSSDGLDLDGILRVTSSEHRKLRAEFRNEAKLARSLFKAQLAQEWDREYPSIGDKENSKNDDQSSSEPGWYDEDEYAYDHFVAVRMEAHDRWAGEKKAMFLQSLKPLPRVSSEETSHALGLRQDRVTALWEGLRRKYFGETETEPDLEDGHPPGTRVALQEDNAALRREISELMERLRRREGVVSLWNLHHLHAPLMEMILMMHLQEKQPWLATLFRAKFLRPLG